MYFIVVCTCGFPIGHIWRKYIFAKLLTHSIHAQEALKLLEEIQNTFADDFE